MQRIDSTERALLDNIRWARESCLDAESSGHSSHEKLLLLHVAIIVEPPKLPPPDTMTLGIDTKISARFASEEPVPSDYACKKELIYL